MNRIRTSTTPPEPGLAMAGSVGPAHTIRFPRGLPGFESCRGFVLMALEGDGTLQCLRSVDGTASFLVIDPRRVDPAYVCELTDADRHHLGSTDDGALLWLALVMVEPGGTITVNLRAPVVVNPARMVGHQVIPHQSPYPLRHVLVEGDSLTPIVSD